MRYLFITAVLFLFGCADLTEPSAVTAAAPDAAAKTVTVGQPVQAAARPAEPRPPAAPAAPAGCGAP